MTDGTRVRLLKDWDDDDPKAQFLRRVRDASCYWFGTTLGPDYNAAHADHFHLQNRGWGTCR
ncbi:extensin family protein [Planktotalea sp.]|uniref:extensin family protein n=1 Tax=Planktotalea sp. TaxID=2029877 RepID=UPI0025F51706|nr:extensin family protein [Planktotalea sp.]